LLDLSKSIVLRNRAHPLFSVGQKQRL